MTERKATAKAPGRSLWLYFKQQIPFGNDRKKSNGKSTWAESVALLQTADSLPE
jgi:hypothetical protein